MSAEVLSNATVLSHFAAVGRLDLLPLVQQPIYVADAVYGELQAGVVKGYTFLADVEAHVFPPNPLGWLRRTGLDSLEEHTLYNSLLLNVNNGEAMSLAIAKIRGWRFLTDDKAAREEGKRLNVAINGTLGVLIQLVEDAIITPDEADHLLVEMINKARYRSPVRRLRDLPQGGK